MSDTAGNQDLAIATNGTSHVATTMGPTDVCKLPNNVPAPFPNFIATSGNLKNGTTNTFVANKPVWIQRSYLGPTSDPGHPGVNKGVASGTYRGIARATSWSKDVQKEGQFVVRTNDSTTQNNANTSGMVAGSPLAGKVSNDDAYQQKLCTLTILEGKCKHGRALGPPPGAKKDEESNYLEILKGDFVEFTSTREDIVHHTKDPGCVKGIHTHWEATKTGGSWKDAAIGGAKSVVGLDPPTHEAKDALKVYRLGGALTGESSVKVGDLKSKKSNVNDFSRRERLKIPKDAGPLGKVADDVKTKDSTGKWAHGDAVTHKVAPDSNAAKLGSKALSTIAQAAVMWDAAAHPAIVTVEASACSGKKTATIKIMPSDKVKVDLFDDSVKAGVNWLRRLLGLVERATSFFGQPARIQFLESPKLTFSIEYKELTADKPVRPGPFGIGTVGPHWKVQCRRAWQLEFSFSPLIGGYAKFTVPIATVLPVAGSAVATLLKWVGARGDFFLKIEIAFAPKGSISWNEYDEWAVSVSDGELSLTFSIGVEIYVTVAEVSVYGYVEGKLWFEKWGPRPGYLLAVDMKGQIQLGAKGAAKANFWGKTYSKDIEYKPDCLKFGGDGAVTLGIRKQPGGAGGGW